MDRSALKALGDCLIPVRWTDLDTYGHVNNARYFDYLTEGRAIILRHLVTPMDRLQFFMVDARCTYLKPIDYPNEIMLKHYLKTIGRTSFTILCDIFSNNESLHYAQSECTLVCFDAEKQKPIRIPEKLLNIFS